MKLRGDFVWSIVAVCVLVVPIQGRGVPKSAEVRADSVLGVFEGRTPCGATATAFTGFPADNCEQIKWRLTLNRDATGSPSTFVYKGSRTMRQGTWTIGHGMVSNPDAIVYRLQTRAGGPSLQLMKADDSILLVMDPGGTLLVGDASASYTLSRTNHAPDLGVAHAS
jgi:hypothetical protein